jgi:hypothetical protein
MTMQRSTSLPLSPALTGLLTALALLAPGCDDASDPAGDEPEVAEPEESAEPGVEDAEPLDPPESDPGFQLGGIDGEFANAAKEFDVPLQLLQAVAYVESQWQMVEGQEEFEGLAPAYGVMALRGDRLRRAAELAGESCRRREDRTPRQHPRRRGPALGRRRRAGDRPQQARRLGARGRPLQRHRRRADRRPGQLCT